MKNIYRYFISFTGKKAEKYSTKKLKFGIRIFGSGIFEIDNELEHPDEFINVKEHIEKKLSLRDVTILFFKKLK